MSCGKWWHKMFFTTWLGTSKSVTRINCIGSKPEIDYWYSEYRCCLCKVIYKIDHTKELENEQY